MEAEENKEFRADVIIVGCGVAGLYCALTLPLGKRIAIITKATAEECDSYLAQGGICMLRDEDDYEPWYQDTMRAGHFENNPESVDIMIRSSQDVIRDLLCYGVRFARTSSGGLRFTREGAHSRERILFHEDITGKEITSRLLRAVRNLPNVTLYENTTMLDILTGKSASGSRCTGVVVSCGAKSPLARFRRGTAADGSAIVPMKAGNVVWACGGIGGLYEHSTNYPHLTGDALAIALRHGIPLQDPDYIQIHPTTLYTGRSGERSFLISESVRGEGGILLDKDMQRFTDELQPRDVVAAAIRSQMQKDGTPHVWLSMERIPRQVILSHFKHIYEKCREEGWDCTKEAIPVVPAQHYFMGGVAVDSWSRTSLAGLYAAGETSCNGVHGKNRLASNSLLESMVFAKRAALNIMAEGLAPAVEEEPFSADSYIDTVTLAAQYRDAALAEIQRMRLYHEQHIA
ncbi:MAG TPA: L-aspartate oxidase [Treponema sp.]|nr:L-aspartate oxidase [Treponema sp.]